MILLRYLLGDILRQHRLGQSRTLREVSGAARISLGYLSEVERGQKEASSELLTSICAALGIHLSQVLSEVARQLAGFEPALATTTPPETAGDGAALPARPDAGLSELPSTPEPVGATATAESHGTIPGGFQFGADMPGQYLPLEPGGLHRDVFGDTFTAGGVDRG